MRLSLFTKNRIYLLALFICLLFFLAYSTLSVIRHQNFQSFGFDLGINSQTVWRYSQFSSPVSTISPYPERPKLFLHVELIYALIAPFYWIYNSPITLLLLQNAFLVSGGLALFLFSKKRLKKTFLSLSILLSYLAFYGVQFAAWTDAHSTSFASAFLAWFIYFLDFKKFRLAFLFLLLSITSKENVALYTLLLSLLYFLRTKKRALLYFIGISFLYLLFLFLFFFPNVTDGQYLYQNKEGLLSNLNAAYLFDTSEKIQTLLYSYGASGFLALLSPFSLILTLSHFFTFFVMASDLPGAQGIFGHYRATLTPFLFWGVILFLEKYKKINKNFVASYLLLCALFLQYHLHLPLSYLTKSWFWERPVAIGGINNLIAKHLPQNASVVSQNNITPHISHRDKIYTLYPTEKNGRQWFYWYDNPEYLIVDTSKNWDARHLLTDLEKYIEGLKNLERDGYVKLYQEIGNAKLYKIVKTP